MLMDLFSGGFRGLRRRGLRTALTILSIAIGVTSVVLISSIGSIGQEAVNQELNSLGLDGITVGRTDKDAISPLREKEAELIRSQAGIEAAAGLNVSYVTLSMRSLSANGIIWGITEQAEDFVSLETLYGRMIRKSDLNARARVCLVDQTVAEAFYKRSNIVGKTITIALDNGSTDFEIIGVVRTGGSMFQGLMSGTIPSFVYVPCTSLQDVTLKSDYDQIAVRVQPETNAQEVISTIVEVLESGSGITGGYRCENIARQKDTLNHLLQIVTLVLEGIAGISLVVSGLGIMTVMIVSVTERTREIGIRKSIGASRGIILLEFLIEALIVSLTGSVIGSVFGTTFAVIVGNILNFTISIPYKTIVLCLLISIFTGVVFGVYPAVTAAKMRPVDALRSF